MNRGIKKIVSAVIVAAVVSLATPSGSNAAVVAVKDSVAVSTADKAHVQYLGVAEEGLWFNIKYANPKGEKFTLLIKNAGGDVLFQGSFTDINFSKKIKILNEESGSITPTFIIKTADNRRIAQSFQVNTASRTVEEVIVTRS